MSEFKAIETQEELDKIIGYRLERQREKFADYEALKERVASLESENGQLKESISHASQVENEFKSEIERYQSTIAGYEMSKKKTSVALRYGLPFEFAERLQGEDEESLAADAERLAVFMKPQVPVPPMKDIEPETAGQDAAWLQAVRDLTKGE